MRFLLTKFPAVVNKLLPQGPPARLQRLLEEDPDHFNDTADDDVTQALANVTLLAWELSQKDFAEP